MKNKLILPFFLIILALLITTPHSTVSASSGPNLQITNLSGATFNFTYDQLLAMPKTTITSDLFCNDVLKTTGDWGGISLSYLLAQTQISPDVLSLDFNATDYYHVSIPISLAMQPQIIIAYDKNNQPLSEGLRLILPGINGPLWIASISSIGMSTIQVADLPPIGTAIGGIPPIPLPPDIPKESISQQQAGQPTPIIPQNQSSPTATTPPVDTSGPIQAKPAIQPSTPQNRLPTIALSIAFALLFVPLAVVYVMVRRRRKTSVANIVSDF